MSSTKVPPVKSNHFDPDLMSFTELKKNDRVSAQKLAYPRYTDRKYGETNPVIQFPRIQLDQYGIPQLGEFYESDADRKFIKVPLGPEHDELREMLERIDERVGGEMKESILGSKHEKYMYQPIVRRREAPDDDSDEEGEKDTRVWHPYIKAMLDVDYTTGHLKTKVFVRNTDPAATEKRTLLDITTITELTEYVNYMSTIRPIVMFNKLYAANSANQSGKRMYGVTMKIVQLEVEPSSGAAGVRSQYQTDAFLSDDEESDDEQDAPAAAAADEQLDDSEGDVGDDLEDSEEEKPKRRSRRSAESSA